MGFARGHAVRPIAGSILTRYDRHALSAAAARRHSTGTAHPTTGRSICRPSMMSDCRETASEDILQGPLRHLLGFRFSVCPVRRRLVWKIVDSKILKLYTIPSMHGPMAGGA